MDFSDVELSMKMKEGNEELIEPSAVKEITAEIEEDANEEDYFLEPEIEIHMDEDLKNELESPNDLLQTAMDAQQHVDDTKAGCSFKSESELAGKHIRNGDVEIHPNINDSTRSKLSSLDSAGLFHISGKIPINISKRVDSDQRQLFESREPLNDEEENDRKKHWSHSSALKTEMKTQSGEKLYLCSMCDYRCTYPSILKKHMTTHTGEKPFLCSMCDYKCSRSSNLKSHMRTHSGEKPLLCSMCDYRCSLASHLKSHMRKHTGEKPFLCSMCGYRCSRSSTLKSHMRIHTGDKPFLCSVCDYRCSQSSNLQTHMKTHTGENNIYPK